MFAAHQALNACSIVSNSRNVDIPSRIIKAVGPPGVYCPSGRLTVVSGARNRELPASPHGHKTESEAEDRAEDSRPGGR